MLSTFTYLNDKGIKYMPLSRVIVLNTIIIYWIRSFLNYLRLWNSDIMVEYSNHHNTYYCYLSYIEFAKTLTIIMLYVIIYINDDSALLLLAGLELGIGTWVIIIINNNNNMHALLFAVFGLCNDSCASATLACTAYRNALETVWAVVAFATMLFTGIAVSHERIIFHI